MTNPVRLRFTDDRTLIYAHIRPQDVIGGRLAPEHLLEALLEADYSSFQFDLDQHAFDDLIHLDWNQLNREIVRCLARRIEFSLSVTIAEDQMQAWATVQPVYQGEEISLDRLLERLSYLGVKQGYLEAALKSILDNSEAEHLLIAEGKKAIPGQDAWLESLTEIPAETKGSSKLVYEVEVGSALVLRHPPTSGQDGYTVTGTPLGTIPGRNLQLTPSSGSDFSPTAPQVLIAIEKGCPVQRFNSVRIDPVLTVDEVTPQTGNLDHPGSILVLGSVHKGTQLKARGHIEILGSVFSADLDAGGDILIHGDVIANGAGLIRAKGRVSAQSLNQVFLEAGRDIYVRTGVYQSHIRSGREIIIGESAETGEILGGHAIALHQFKVGQIGNLRKGKTVLHLGLDDFFLDHYEEKIYALSEERQALDQTLKKLIQARAQKLPHLKPEHLERKVNHLERQVELLRDELHFLNQDLRKHPNGIQLEIGKAIWPLLELSMGPYKLNILSVIEGPLKFYVDENNTAKIVMENLTPPAELSEHIPEPHRAESPHKQLH
jgi:uncharacterized protein